MVKMPLLGFIILFLTMGIVYIDKKAKLNIIDSYYSDHRFRKEGFIINYPFNELRSNSEGLSYAKENESSKPDSKIVSAYYYIDDSNPNNYRFLTINTFDLTSPFTEKSGSDEIYYNGYLNSTLKAIPQEFSPHRLLLKNAPSLVYHYQKDLGDGVIIPTKAAIICINKKAYYIEASAVTNVDEWFDKIEQSISFFDFSKMRIYGISFIILLSIGVIIALFFIIKEINKNIKSASKQGSMEIWVNDRARKHYKYVAMTNYLTIIIVIVTSTMWNDIGGNGVFIIGILLIMEMAIKNTLIMKFLKKQAPQEYSEDYLIPQWFKNRFYKHINNKAELRVLLLFLFLPLFYIVPLPYVGTAAFIFYIVPVFLLIMIYWGIKGTIQWIGRGANESI